MKIPSIFYGKYADVKKRVKRVLADLNQGTITYDSLSADMIDTEDNQGLIVLSGPSRIIGASEHFNVYVFMHEYYFGSAKARDSEFEQELFTKSLESPWGLLLLMGDARLKCFDSRPDRVAQFIASCYKFRHDLFGAGSRYSIGLAEPIDLSNSINSLNYCLAQSGVDHEMLKTSIRVGGLEELLVNYVEKGMLT